MEGTNNIIYLAHKTDAEAVAGAITHPGNDHKIEKNEKHDKLVQRQFPSFKKNLYKYLVEYSSNSTIQGLRYMGEPSRPTSERLAWLVFFCISLGFCIYLVTETYTKWNVSPVLVSFATSPTAIWKIPFPAITICSVTKARQSVYNFTQNAHRMLDNSGHNNMSVKERKQFGDLSMVCDGNLDSEGNDTIGYDSIDFLMKVAPDFDEILWACDYGLTDGDEKCKDLFTPILTEEGICYTFNMLNRSEVFRENVFQYGNFMSHENKSEGWTLAGYPKNTPIDTYPRRAVSAGFQSRFGIILKNVESDNDYTCKGPVQGFKVILHHPAETPRVKVHFLSVSNLQDVIVAVKPEMMTTSSDLRDYDPHIRQCYYPEERPLAFYLNYTQQNCEMECLTNFTRERCKCVGFHMPHEKETPICGPGSISCMDESDNIIRRRELKFIVDMEKSKRKIQDTRENSCDCLPGCTSLNYNVEISQSTLTKDRFLQALRADISEYEDVEFTRINLLFKEQQFITSERNELYGITDFLANCGGLLGLFTGFSFLSVLEILYFVSLRLFSNIKRYGRNFWSGSQELVDKYYYTNS